MPYQKRIKGYLCYHHESDDGKSFISISVINFGRIPIIIENVEFKDWKGRVIQLYDLNEQEGKGGLREFPNYYYLEPGRSVSGGVCTDDANVLKNAMNLNYRFCLIVRDSEGRKYRFRKGFAVG